MPITDKRVDRYRKSPREVTTEEGQKWVDDFKANPNNEKLDIRFCEISAKEDINV